MSSFTWEGFFLCLIVIITLFGNILVLHVLTKPKRRLLKRPLYIFIFNICVVDIAVVVFSIIFKTIDEFSQDWIFGDLMCRMIEYTQRTLFRVNILTHVFIATDRFISVVFPFKPQLKRRRAKHCVILAWFFSFIISIPFLFVFNVRQRADFRICMIVHLPWTWMEKLHTAVDLFLFFLIPLGVMLWLYASIISSLNRRKKQSGDIGSRHATLATVRAAIRGVRVSMIVLIAFTCCWIPVIAKGFNRLLYENVNTDRTDPLYATAMYFAFFNDALVPLLYCGLDSNLQPAASKLLGCLSTVHPEETSEDDGTRDN